ncbi:MAG TPA: DUF932 domain-containing protein [Kineosporiaceae bacterium]
MTSNAFFAPARGEQRNLSLSEMVSLLREEAAHRLDVIAGSGALRCEDARLVLSGTEPQIGPDGVTMADGTYDFNDVSLGQVADKLGIPLAYLKRLHTDIPQLFDQNVNTLLSRTDRRFLVRARRTPDPGRGLDSLAQVGLPGQRATASAPGTRGLGGDGVVSALLSDKYHRLDNLDVALAALEGVRASGAQVQVDGCDLTERRLYVRLYAPSVAVAAPALLHGYRSPFNGRSGDQLPVVWAGFVLSNSEVGCGAFTLTPRLHVQVCSNGLVIPAQGVRRAHLGARHDGDDGVVTWSQATTQRALDLITSRTVDAVTSYLDADNVARMVRELEAAAGAPVRDPDTTLKVVTTRLKIADSHVDNLLAHFHAGASHTAGGVLHAFTSYAQTLTDADTAHELESLAVQAMHLAAAGATA